MNMILIIVCFGLGCFFAGYAYDLGIGSLHTAGPGLMPFLIGVFLAGSSLCLGFATIMENRKNRDVPGAHKSMKETMDVNFKKAGITIVSLILYATVMEYLGFIVATFLLLSGLFLTLGVKRLPSLVGSLGTVIVCYVVFNHLGLRLPIGVLRYVGL